MNYHKLLSRQISKFLPGALTNNPEMQKFLSAINDSYIAADKDKELAARAFSISEEEYREVNQQLAKEVEVRKQSIEKLKETVGKITGEEKKENTDDLLMIARYLLQQVNKRKNAELVFTSLIANLKNAVLLEDENRKLVFVNSRFCNLFDIQGAPDTLQGMNCDKVFQATKNKFKSPDQFIQSINILLEKKEVSNNDIIECADGRVFERDYIPIVHDGKYKGHLWSYTDITEKKIKEEAYKRISLVASANHSGVLFTDATGKINWCNEGFSKLTGFSRIETIGKTPIELCRGPLTDLGSLEKIMEEFFKGNPFHIDIIYYRKDGTWFWGRSYTQPVKDDNGNVTEYFGIIDDITEEKEMENRFRLALNKIGDNLWEHNYLTGETKFSDEKHQLLGYDQHDFNTNKDLWWKNIYPGDLPLLQQNHRDYISGEKSHHTLEYRMVHKTGELRWVLDKGVVIEKDVNNKPVRIIGTHTDITAIKETEKALRENQELFRSLEENIPGVLYKYEFSPAGEESFIYISPDAEKKIGFTEKELQNFYKLLHPDDVIREKAASDQARKINGPYHFEGRFAIEGKPVQWLDLSSSFSHVKENGSRVYTGIILNTTKEKEAEHVIQLHEKKYRNIIENMNLGLLEVDTREIIQYANQSFCDMSGYGLEELIGNKASNLFVRDEDTQLMEMKNDNRKKGVSDVYEIAVKNKEGKTKWWLISGAPRYTETGELIGSVGIHLDITEQKELEHELVEARELAESSAKAKQSFLANMSHEIRTPMNAIMGMSRQLEKTSLDDNQKFYLKIIHSAADNLLVIINDILDLSKLEAGKLTVEEIGFKVKDLVEQVTQVMMHKAEEKGLALSYAFTDPLPADVLIGDPYRINQVLLNLVSNAIKFTEKGKVDITCKVFEEKNLQHVEFTVSDTGIGMDETFMKNLFQKFRQEDESVTRRFGGTGLGMSICKELIEFMGGTISVESKKNVGTKVVFNIPLKAGTVDDLPNKETIQLDNNMLKGKRILITDDNEMNRLVATTILNNYGAVSEEAQNGIEAIEKIKNNSYDLVLMDVQMPVMDGIEATRLIRENISRKLPIIALTALALKGDAARFIEAGMNDYLSKPFDENQLLQITARWLGTPEIVATQKKHYTDAGNALFNLKRLEDIANGDRAFIHKMINIFIDQGPVSAMEIANAYNNKDFEKVNKTAHRLKSSIDLIGITTLQEDIREIESCAKTGDDSPRLQELVDKLGKIIGEVVQQLKAA